MTQGSRERAEQAQGEHCTAEPARPKAIGKGSRARGQAKEGEQDCYHLATVTRHLQPQATPSATITAPYRQDKSHCVRGERGRSPAMGGGGGRGRRWPIALGTSD